MRSGGLKFDVSNLVASQGNEVMIDMHRGLGTRRSFWGSGLKLIISTGAGINYVVNDSAKEGETPISQLIVLGHSKRTVDYIANRSSSKRFSAAELLILQRQIF